MSASPNEPRKQYRQRKFFIYPSFQVRYIGWMLVPMLLNIVGFYIVSRFLVHAIRLQIQAYLVVDGGLWKELSDAQDRTILWTFVSGAVFSTFLIVAAGLAASHRIAGPMVRLRNELRRVATSRRFVPIRFRKKDVFREVADDYNGAMAALTGEIPPSATPRAPES